MFKIRHIYAVVLKNNIQTLDVKHQNKQLSYKINNLTWHIMNFLHLLK